jgi:hypothetical protein
MKDIKKELIKLQLLKKKINFNFGKIIGKILS